VMGVHHEVADLVLDVRRLTADLKRFVLQRRVADGFLLLGGRRIRRLRSGLQISIHEVDLL
jgi:hypothetical protein